MLPPESAVTRKALPSQFPLPRPIHNFIVRPRNLPSPISFISSVGAYCFVYRTFAFLAELR